MPDPDPYLPVMLRVGGRPCLVVGGGAVALRKIESLLQAGAVVTVVSPEVLPQIAALARAGQLIHEARCFAAADVAGNFLVVAATGDAAANGAVVAACASDGILCAAVDQHWRAGDIISPAVVRHDGMVFTVSSGGRSHARTRCVKERLQEWLARQSL